VRAVQAGTDGDVVEGRRRTAAGRALCRGRRRLHAPTYDTERQPGGRGRVHRQADRRRVLQGYFVGRRYVPPTPKPPP